MRVDGQAISSLLFVCSLNMVRSPLAATIARGLYGDQLFVRSAGVEKGQEDPFVRRVLEDMQFDTPFSEPKALDALGDSFFDMAIVLSPQAEPYLRDWSRDKSMTVEVWPTEDPTKTEGNMAQRLDAYRATRDALMHRIVQRFGPATRIR